MQTEIVIAGFGGQGVMFAGQLLAYAALDLDRHVTWMPSYGPEMRGGTANCTVIVSDEAIGSPIVRNPSVVLVMNQPSLEKYEPLVMAGGLIVVNQSLVNAEPKRQDLEWVWVAANDVAESIGDRRLANLVMLGAFLQRRSVFSLDEMGQALTRHIPDRHRHMIQANLEALQQGAVIGLHDQAAISN